MKIQPFPFAIGLAIGTLLFILMVGAGAFGAEITVEDTGPAKCYPLQIEGWRLDCEGAKHDHENKESRRAPTPDTPDDDGGCEAQRSGR